MKNIEIISATALTSPKITKTIAIIQVTIEAFIGSLSEALPLANHLFTAFDGKDRSMDKACKVLGATITEPKADEIVEAAKPRGSNAFTVFSLVKAFLYFVVLLL